MVTSTNVRLLLATAVLAVTLAGCSRPTETPATAEAPTLDVTHYTADSELFMEYPPLVTGETVRFAVHLTRLSDFSALTEGRPRIELTPEAGGAATTLPGIDPLRPGVFRVEGTLPSPGRYTMVLVVDIPGLRDRHDLGAVTVFADQATAWADAEKAAGPEDPTAVTYLKEQQWTNPFATTLAETGEMESLRRLPGSVQPMTGGEAIVSAPADGRFTSERLASIGDMVKAGQVLGRLEPRLSEGNDRASLVADATAQRIALDGARVELARAERLLAERAVPARRVEDAKRAVATGEAQLAAAEARLAQRDEALATGGGVATGNAFVLRAPLTGRIVEVMATLGAGYDEGAPLFRIVKTDEVELQVYVPAADVPAVRDVGTLVLEVPGRAVPLEVRPHHRHDSGVVNAETGALTIQFEVDNPGGRQLLIGQPITVVLRGQQRQQLTTVPAEAVLMQAGRPYVFVHTSGETFSRRMVEIGERDGTRVGLRSGVMPGERVVTRGAYQIQLASAATGLPAEGHVH